MYASRHIFETFSLPFCTIHQFCSFTPQYFCAKLLSKTTPLPNPAVVLRPLEREGSDNFPEVVRFIWDHWFLPFPRGAVRRGNLSRQRPLPDAPARPYGPSEPPSRLPPLHRVIFVKYAEKKFFSFAGFPPLQAKK